MEDKVVDQVRAGEISLQNLSRSEKTHGICLAAVQFNGLAIQHVPKYLRSLPIYFSAVYQNANAIKWVPWETVNKHPELLQLALGRKGTLMEWAAKNHRDRLTKEMCQLAVNSHGMAVKWVPDRFRDAEMVRTAVIRDGMVLLALEENPAFIKEIASQIALKYLPDQFKTKELCLEQVRKQGRVLQHVPADLIDDEILEAALASNPWALEFVPITKAWSPAVQAAIKSGACPEHLVVRFRNLAAG